jgi:chromosome segregation and condensation protein ScpB
MSKSKMSKSEQAERMLFRSKHGVTRKQLERLTGWRTGLNMSVALERARATHPKAKLIERDGRFRFAA